MSGRVAVSWAVVLVPVGYGLVETITKVVDLFTA